MNSIKALFFLSLSTLLLPACTTTTVPEGVPVSKEAESAFGQALKLARAGQTSKAIKAFTQLAVAEPRLTGAHVNLGLLYLKEGDYTKAAESLQQAVVNNPNHAVAYNHLGIALRKQGKFDEARTAYEQALRIDAGYALAHLNYGILLDLYMGKLGEALEHYRRYQSLTGAADKTEKWIVDLERQQSSAAASMEDHRG